MIPVVFVESSLVDPGVVVRFLALFLLLVVVELSLLAGELLVLPSLPLLLRLLLVGRTRPRFLLEGSRVR